MQEQNGQVHIVVIGGSVRPGNYTGKALSLVADELERQEGVALDIINPVKLDLSQPGLEDASGDGAVIREAVSRATGVILVSPEYHGSVSSVMKLVIENLGFPSVLAGKPMALLGVAAGEIGAVKSLEQLRSICSHIGAIVLPRAVSVAHVQEVFTEDGNCTDPEVTQRIRGVGTALIEYIKGRA
ncbi:MAG: NADPH-dependent oxidoreductase [Armatimonadetes bacterium CG_4_9_14_3_um_filter_58_7]|nr:MAG: NADPH-dependent oxidoreductase [Armatimonadetes bacterium CG_4_9_14_3_um_filter_58_7]